MGRMLDSLKHLNGQGNGSDAKPAPPTPPQTSPAATKESEPQEAADLPYIEVGAPDKKIDASPSVLAASPPSPAKTPAASPNPSPNKQAALVATLTEPGPLGISFESWPTKRGGGVARDIIAYHQPDHPTSKQYRELLAKMTDGLQSAHGRVIVCVGAAPQVGVTTVLLNLAFSAGAATKGGVVVVDGNTAHPAVAERLGLGRVAGLSEILAGSAAVEKAMLTTAQLHVLAAGTLTSANDAPPNEAVRWVIAWLRERYETILVDGGDLSETKILAPLAAAADSVYLVLPQHDSGSAAGCSQAITRLGGRLRGLIHTRFEDARSDRAT